MTTVRQTVHTVHSSGPPLDNSLDALLEDLQTSVNQGSTATMNGLATTAPVGARTYREVTERIHHETSTVPGSRDYQIQYLTPANTTTIVTERSSSPLISPSGDRTVSYKTVQYEYNTSKSAKPLSMSDSGVSVSSTSDPTSDARLRQNLNELDSLLVDLHEAQKTGFGTVPGKVVTTTTTRTEIAKNVDPSHLETVETVDLTPAPPSRQPQHLSRSVQYKQYSTQQYGDINPPLQPKRSSSAQRELVFDDQPIHRTRSPSPSSPRIPQRTIQKEVYYETKTNSARSPSVERYRERSPSNQRLQREMLYEGKSSNTVSPSPRSDRYREMSPTAHRRGVSPVRHIPVVPDSSFSSQPAGTSKITSVRSYNYSTTGSSPAPVNRSPYPDSSPSPVSINRSYNETITDTTRSSNYRSPSPSRGVPYTSTPLQPKVTTTVRTYTYEYPPGSNQRSPPRDIGIDDRTLTYQVSPQQPREPLIIHPQEPPPPPTVITYKYSTHSSHNTTNRYPPPEEQQTLLPRPFPTTSPTPSQPAEPPKRLDDLMASFSDTEVDHPPNRYYSVEKHVTSSTHSQSTPHAPPPPVQNNTEVAVIPPTPNMKQENKSELRERIKSVNKEGPPVYYPPGVELFAKKEEAMVIRESGQKASGKYKYEAASESKSKSSSGGGAAVVPVCLPLCCAMPCVIM